MLAIIRTGGKQYKIEEGDKIIVEKIEGEIGSKIVFAEVLLVDNGKEVKIGNPTIEKAEVEGTILSQKKDVKKKTVKHKAKKRQLTKKNHRQEITEVKIEKISA